MAQQQPERRARAYRLTYADGTTEDTTGIDAVLAVAARTRPERPVQVADLTGIDEWTDRRKAAREDATAARP